MDKVMKLAKVLLALILSLPLAVKANAIQPPKGFVGDAFKATMVLHGRRGRVETTCTVAAYQSIVGGYNLLGAGHCVEKSDGWVYTVADDLGASETPVSVVKSEFDQKFDFAIFQLKTDKIYPTLQLGNDADVAIGDAIINPNFAAGAAKQLSFGIVSSASMDKEFEPNPGAFFVQIFGASGSSGSPIISASTHKIIGIVVTQYTDGGENDTGSVLPLNIGMGVEPIDNFQAFLNAPVIVIPHISDQEFKQKYGPEHPFKLMVQGVEPEFDFGGHTFQVDVGIMAPLSDDYYYNVPVYIDKRDDGYWLVSTKDAPNYGVEVKLLS